MRGQLLCGLVAAMAGITLSVAGAPGAGALAAPGPGSLLWAARYDGPGQWDDTASAVAVSPGGGTVFVTGQSWGTAELYGYATVAYNTMTGATQWVRRYDGPGSGNSLAEAIAVSPGGGTVFVTGESGGPTSGYDYATVAYNATTGARLWAARYNGPGNGTDMAHSVTVSPDGQSVFVTGESTGTTPGYDYATIAYNATTGARMWVRRYHGPSSDNVAYSVTASPDGKAVFVTGGSYTASSADNYATIAYNSATGKKLWVRRYNGPGNNADTALSVAVSPSGGAVFVTGQSPGATSGYDYATIAYNAATGTRLWISRYNGPGNRDDMARSLAVSPDGGMVFVTGPSTGATSGGDYATVAYNAATGAQLWAARYNGPGNGDDRARSVSVSPDGQTVYVTGQSTGATSGYDYATVAYHAATGTQLWVRRYNGPTNGDDVADSVAVSPTTGAVFVTGPSTGARIGDNDYATLAYHG